MKRTLKLGATISAVTFGCVLAWAQNQPPDDPPPPGGEIPGCTWGLWQCEAQGDYGLYLKIPETVFVGQQVTITGTVVPNNGLMSRYGTSQACLGLIELGIFTPAIPASISWSFVNAQQNIVGYITPTPGPWPTPPSYEFTMTFTPQFNGLLEVTLISPPDVCGGIIQTRSASIKLGQYGLVASWQFDHGYGGDQGQEPTAQSFTQLVPSWNGSALQMDQAGAQLSYLGVEPDGRPNIKRYKGTLAMWLKPQVLAGTGVERTLVKITGGSQDWRVVLVDHPQGQVRFVANGAQVLDASGVGLEVDRWHHLALTYNETETKLYLDGVLKLTGSAVTGSGVAVSALYLGGDHLGNPALADFEDVRTYNTVLSAGDVSQIYAAGRNLDSDGDTLSNLDELYPPPPGRPVTDPLNYDTDGDGVNDALDAYPTDPSRSTAGTGSSPPGPTITLRTPPNS